MGVLVLAYLLAISILICWTRKLNLRCDDCTDDAHDSVQRNRNTVSSAAMSGGQHFWSVGIQCSIVDVLQNSQLLSKDDARPKDMHTKQKLIQQVKARF